MEPAPRPAQEELRAVVARFTQSGVARKIRAYQQLVSKWLAGEHFPNLFHALMLDALFDVRIDGWLTPEQRDALQEARRAREDGTVAAAREALARIQPLRSKPVRARRARARTRKERRADG